MSKGIKQKNVRRCDNLEQKNDKLKTYAVKVFEGEVMYSAVNGTVNEWEGKPTGYVLNLKVTSKEVEKLKTCH